MGKLAVPARCASTRAWYVVTEMLAPLISST
ncbi:MAG: hypothetical protein ACI9W2_002273, partial [Gammaproteobacteria bacterium]